MQLSAQFGVLSVPLNAVVVRLFQRMKTISLIELFLPFERFSTAFLKERIPIILLAEVLMTFRQDIHFSNGQNPQ